MKNFFKKISEAFLGKSSELKSEPIVSEKPVFSGSEKVKEPSKSPKMEATQREPAKANTGIGKFRKRENVSAIPAKLQELKLQDSSDKLVKKHHGYKGRNKKNDLNK